MRVEIRHERREKKQKKVGGGCNIIENDDAREYQQPN